MHVVLEEEANLPPGATPVCRLVRTTLPVITLATALQCVHWYSGIGRGDCWSAIASALNVGVFWKNCLEDARWMQQDLATFCIVV